MEKEKLDFLELLNKIKDKHDCDLHITTGLHGTFWCHQDALVSIDITDELLKNKIPVETTYSSFDLICGRYFVRFKIPKRLNFQFE